MRKLKKLFKISPYRASIKHCVPFHDVDMMEVVWYGNYIKYIDMARAKLAIAMHIDYYELRNAGIMAPVVKHETHYKSYAKYNDEITINAYFIPENKMVLRTGYEILNSEGTVLTLASTEQMFVDGENAILIYDNKLDKVIPEELRPYFGA